MSTSGSDESLPGSTSGDNPVPIRLYAFFLAGQTLSRISRNELRASRKQRSHLKWIMVVTMFVVPVALLIFMVILKSQ